MIRIRPITHAEVIEWLWIDGVEVRPDAYILVRNERPGFRTRMPMIKLDGDDAA